jgi:transcriptional regulator with XRE-family HTH domain
MRILVRGRIVRSADAPGLSANALKVLGERVRERRKVLGWTQEEFAEEAGIDRSYAGGIERGERNVTFSILCQICGALRCDVASLTAGLPMKPRK